MHDRQHFVLLEKLENEWIERIKILCAQEGVGNEERMQTGLILTKLGGTLCPR